MSNRNIDLINTSFGKVFCLVLLAIIGYSMSSLQFKPRESNSTFMLVIDAGHGGKHPGSLGKYSKEKDVTLQIAKKLQTIIQKNDPKIKVFMTRNNDSYVDLVDRANESNKRNADLFVSIHCNANDNKTVYGTETYAVGVHMNKAQVDVMMRENADMMKEEDYQKKYDGFDPKSLESYIIFKIHQHAHVNNSLKLASMIEDQFKQTRTSRGVKQAGFWVLWATTMPAVLVETGFISNSTEEKYLNSNEGQQFLASSIYKAIKEYKKVNHP